MKFEQFDKNACNALRDELQAVLKKYGADADLKFKVGRMKYTDTSVEIKVEATVSGGQTMAEEGVVRMAKSMGLKVDGIGGRRLVEYKSANWKYPFVYEMNGKRYKCDRASAKHYFAA